MSIKKFNDKFPRAEEVFGRDLRYISMDNDGFLSAEEVFGRDLRYISRSLRVFEELIDGEAIANLYGDNSVNPCSGGVIGWKNVCGSLGLSRQALDAARRRGDPLYSFIKFDPEGGPASCHSSLHWYRTVEQPEARKAQAKKAADCRWR